MALRPLDDILDLSDRAFACFPAEWLFFPSLFLEDASVWRRQSVSTLNRREKRAAGGSVQVSCGTQWGFRSRLGQGRRAGVVSNENLVMSSVHVPRPHSDPPLPTASPELPG